jgi:hypothetical protein
MGDGGPGLERGLRLPDGRWETGDCSREDEIRSPGLLRRLADMSIPISDKPSLRVDHITVKFRAVNFDWRWGMAPISPFEGFPAQFQYVARKEKPTGGVEYKNRLMEMRRIQWDYNSSFVVLG